MRVFICLMLVAGAAFGDERTIRLTNPSTQRGMQEIATIFRTVGDITTVAIDAPHASFAVSGTAAQLDLADWIVNQVDRPVNWQPSEQERNNPATREFSPKPADPKGIVRAFYLTNTLEPRPTQETLTILRTVLDVQKIFNYTDRHMLVYRGPAAQLDAVDWVLKILDAPAGTPVPKEPWIGVGRPFFDAMRVFALPKNTTDKQMQELITVLRATDYVQKVFCRTAPPLLVVAGTAQLLDQTEKRVAALN